MARKRYPITAEEVWKAAWSLPDEERGKWLHSVRAMIVRDALFSKEELKTIFRNQAIARNQHLASEDYDTFSSESPPGGEFKLELWAGHLLQQYDQLQQLWSTRNKKSSPETVQRNYEMIRQHQKNPKVWTRGKLASHYNIPKPYVSLVLKNAGLWIEKAKEHGLVDGLTN
jgi:hypothetical protein